MASPFPSAATHQLSVFSSTACFPPCALLLPQQVIAYNKVDLPDSGDYWEFVKEYLRVSD